MYISGSSLIDYLLISSREDVWLTRIKLTLYAANDIISQVYPVPAL